MVAHGILDTRIRSSIPGVNIVERHNINFKSFCYVYWHFNSTTRYILSDHCAVDQSRSIYNTLVLLLVSFAALNGSEGDYTASCALVKRSFKGIRTRGEVVSFSSIVLLLPNLNFSNRTQPLERYGFNSF